MTQGHGTIKGPPGPEDEQYRCQGRSRTTGERCKRWAAKGYRFCIKHGGKRRKNRSAQSTVPVRTKDQMKKRFYMAKLGPTLKASLEAQLDASPAEQLALFEELALMREITSDALVLYDAAKGAGDKIAPDALLAAGSIAREALGSVVEVADKAAKIESAIGGKITVSMIGHVVNQLIRVVHECFGDLGMERLEQFEKLVREKVTLPTTGAQGTMITPDQDAIDMDDSVPAEPEDEE